MILYRGRNFTTRAGLRSITAELEAEAAGGRQPRLLIAVDQEGGGVKQLPWAPPVLSPPQIGADGSAAEALAQGTATGRALRRLGVNADLAPVADVPASPRSFMLASERTWSSLADATSRPANAFADGLERGGVVPVMKHFPGLGYADENTDSHVEEIAASRAELAPGLAPYRAAIARRIPMIMLSNAVYDAYDGANAAGWSAAVATRLLRGELGYRGVTITDSLDGAAHARGTTDVPLALRAARAGTDMILVTGSEATSRGVYISSWPRPEAAISSGRSLWRPTAASRRSSASSRRSGGRRPKRPPLDAATWRWVSLHGSRASVARTSSSEPASITWTTRNRRRAGRPER